MFLSGWCIGNDMGSKRFHSDIPSRVNSDERSASRGSRNLPLETRLLSGEDANKGARSRVRNRPRGPRALVSLKATADTQKLP